MSVGRKNQSPQEYGTSARYNVAMHTKTISCFLASGNLNKNMFIEISLETGSTEVRVINQLLTVIYLQ